MVEPLQGIVVGTGDTSKLKPALFVVSCGEGHLDLRTADKVHIYMLYFLLYVLQQTLVLSWVVLNGADSHYMNFVNNN